MKYIVVTLVMFFFGGCSATNLKQPIAVQETDIVNIGEQDKAIAKFVITKYNKGDRKPHTKINIFINEFPFYHQKKDLCNNNLTLADGEYELNQEIPKTNNLCNYDISIIHSEEEKYNAKIIYDTERTKRTFQISKDIPVIKSYSASPIILMLKEKEETEVRKEEDYLLTKDDIHSLIRINKKEDKTKTVNITDKKISVSGEAEGFLYQGMTVFLDHQVAKQELYLAAGACTIKGSIKYNKDLNRIFVDKTEVFCVDDNNIYKSKNKDLINSSIKIYDNDGREGFNAKYDKESNSVYRMSGNNYTAVYSNLITEK